MTRVEAVRKQKKLSLTDVSVLSGLDRSTIHRAERLTVKPRRRTIVALARGLDISSRRLWELSEADWADRVLAEHEAAKEAV